MNIFLIKGNVVYTIKYYNYIIIFNVTQSLDTS